MGDVRPDLRILTIDFKPLFESRFSVRLYRIDWAFRLTNTAVDAFVGVNDKHVLTLVKAVNWANLDAVHVLTFDAALIDYVGQLRLLRTIRVRRNLTYITRLRL